MAKKKGQRHRTEHGTHPSRSTMQVEDGKDNRNVRPPTADPANVKKDTDLDQQFAKLREDADKSLQEAQENARREAERQEQIKKVEAEANEMYRQKNADTVHVDDNDRYMAAKYQEQISSRLRKQIHLIPAHQCRQAGRRNIHLIIMYSNRFLRCHQWNR